MNILVSFPGLDFPQVQFSVDEKITVKDAIEEAGSQWNVETAALELSYNGEILLKDSVLASHGIGVDSVIEASFLNVFDRDWIVDVDLNKKLQRHYEINHSTSIQLNTKTFGDGDNNGCLYFDGSWFLPATVHQISFVNSHPSVTAVSNNFFFENSITTLNLSGLTSVTVVYDYFMYGCHGVISVDLSGLRNTTQIGSSFMEGCCSVVELDLSGLCNASEIGSNFLSGCTSIKELKLCSLEKVTSIDSNFLCDCNQITKLNLDGLRNLSQIPDGFLRECSSLLSLDFKKFDKVVHISDSFLYNNSSMTSLDLSGFQNVVSISTNFLVGCTSLSAIDTSSFYKLLSINNNVVEGSSVTDMSVGELRNMSIGS